MAVPGSQLVSLSLLTRLSICVYWEHLKKRFVRCKGENT